MLPHRRIQELSTGCLTVPGHVGLISLLGGPVFPPDFRLPFTNAL